MTCEGPPLIGRWLNHIEGGVKLIEIRGFEQLHHQAGLELFTQIRIQIVRHAHMEANSNGLTADDNRHWETYTKRNVLRHGC